MTLSSVIFKNFMAHAKRYISFFVCSSFSIMVMLMFSSLKYNSNIAESIDITSSELISASLISIIVFAFFFENYAYVSFIKTRNSELGLFMALGMNTKDIRKLLFVENISIIGLSLGTGLLFGTVMSRLFFMVILDILGMSLNNYIIQAEGYIFTIIVFLIIFLIMVVYGNYIVGKLEVIDLLKYNKKAERSPSFKPVIGILGLLIIISGFILKYLDAIKMIGVREVSTKFTILCLSGLYLLITHFWGALLKVLGSRSKVYIKHLLTITELNYKIGRSKTALYIMTVLSALTLFFIGYSFSVGLTNYKSNQREETVLMFISCFLALLFFMSSVCIIYFRLFSELGEERIRYKKLLSIGITCSEVSRYVSVELKVLFFVPLVLGILIIYPYTIIDNLNRSELGQIIINLLIIVIIYAVLQLAFYLFAKRKLVKEIMKE